MLIVYTLLALFLLVCFIDWRKGIFVCLVIGFLQDPLRKLVVGEPVYFTVLVIPYILVTLLGAISSVRSFRLGYILKMYSGLKLPFWIFTLIVLVQAVRGWVATGNMAIFGIGFLGYFAPLPASLLAFHYSVRSGNMVRFLKFYVIIGAIFISGVYAEAMGFDWPILGNVGESLYFYLGGPKVLHAGIMRSPEISAWHGAMVTMLGLVCFLLSPPGLRRYLWLIFSGIALTAIIFTGRRKGFAEVGLFVFIALVLSFYGKLRFLKAYIRSIILGGVLAVLIYQLIPFRDLFSSYDAYIARITHDVSSRSQIAWSMVFDAPKWVIRRNGLWGSGAGMGSQGAQHFGGIRTGAAAEGGLAKVLAELGVVGIGAFLWICLSLGVYFWKIIRYARKNRFYGPLAVGLAAILLANGLNFSVAHQAFGDPFILSFLGFLLGFLLAVPLLISNQRWIINDRQRTTRYYRPSSMTRRPPSVVH